MFEDSHGPREIGESGNPIGYDWQSDGALALGRLTAIQVELDSARFEGTKLPDLEVQLAAGMVVREEGYVRMYDPWVADSLDVPAIRWLGNGTIRLLRLDFRLEVLRDRRAKLAAFDSMSPPKHMGRWISSKNRITPRRWESPTP